jgi:hypothetical protein
MLYMEAAGNSNEEEDPPIDDEGGELNQVPQETDEGEQTVPMIDYEERFMMGS